MRSLPLFALAVLLLVPGAQAHGIEVPDQDRTRRLLADYNDDCGGDAGALTGACRGSNDLIELDLRERWDGTKDVAVFRLYMDKGQAGKTHADTITLDGPKGPMAFTMSSTDDSRFANDAGFDAVGAAQPIQDGTRFVVEGTVALEKLGKPGDRISNVRVEARANGQVGDFMPGGCHNTVGECQVNENDGVHVFPTVPFTLTGPSYFASLSAAGGRQQVAAGAERLVQLDVRNLLQLTSQQAELGITGQAGVTARFHDPSGTGESSYRDVERFGIGARQSEAVHIALAGLDAGAKGSLTVTLTTDLGGRVQMQVPYEVLAAGMTPGPTSPAAVPLAAPPFAAIALLALAAVARKVA